MIVTRLKEYACPVCCKVMDAMSSVGGEAVPEPGDLTICAYCLTICVWMGEDHGIRAATSEECNYVPLWLRNKIAMATSRGYGKPS